MSSLATPARSTLRHWTTRHGSLVLLLAIVAVGLLLRLHQIGGDALWIDEAFSVWLARRPLGEMVRWVRDVDHHPPLYYALLLGWTAVFGAGEASARSLSALFGVLTIPVIYRLGRRLANEKLGLVAALLLAVSPFHVRFAQEARMYTLLTLSASLATHAFVRLWSDGARSAGPTRSLTISWIGYVVFSALMLWTHNTAIVFPIAANLLVLGRLLIRRRASAPSSPAGFGRVMWLRSWLVAQAAVCLLWLPWLPAFLSQAVDVYRRFWLPAPTLGTVLGVIGALLCDFLPWSLLITAIVDVMLAGLALSGLWELRRRSAPVALLGGLFVTPFVAQWCVSLWRPILYARTLIWVSIPLYLMVAAGVVRLEIGRVSRAASRGLTLAALVALVALSSVGLCNYYVTFEKESWDRAADLVAARVQPNDLLLFNDAWGQIPFDYYFSRLYNPRSQPSRAKSTEGPAVAEHGLPVDLFARGVLEPKMSERDIPRLRALVADRQRVWLVYSHQWYTDPQGLIPQALAATLSPRQQWTFRGLQVHLYVED
jgi:uncharacterized membrane protein